MKKTVLYIICFFSIFLYSIQSTFSAEIVQHLRWAWSENIGWINFSPNQGDVKIQHGRFTGIIWSQSHGWINLSPENGGITVKDFLQSDGRCMASLEGQAWGRNTGWIDFSESFIDNNGEFYGFAYGHITGKITFGGETFRLRSTYIPNCTGITVQDRELSQRSLGNVTLDFSLDAAPPTNSSVDREAIVYEGKYSVLDDFSYCNNVSNLKNPGQGYTTGRFNDEARIRHLEEVLKFAELGIVSGYSNGNFGPGNVVTRAEFLKLLFVSHCYDYSGLNYKSKFSDVPTGTWQNRVVNKATELGIINGDTTSYNTPLLENFMYHGNSGADVQELKKVFAFLGLYSGAVDTYYGNDFRNAMVNFQLDNGIISSRFEQGAGSWGPGTQRVFFAKYPENSIPVFRPDDYITKMEALKIILNTSGMKSVTQVDIPYTDVYTDWQIQYIRTGLAAGILESNNRSFHPNHGVERQDVIHMIYNTIQRY